MVCSTRKRLLLWALANSIRLITPRQLARWWGVSTSNARRDLRRLASAGFTQEITIRARRLPAFNKPLYRWYPGSPEPDFGKLSYQAKARFRDLPPITEGAFLPTRLTLGEFAVHRQMKLKHGQSTHEVGLTEAYLYSYKNWPRLTVRCWRGEDSYACERVPGEKIEDAHFVHPKTGRVLLAIEYAGTYPKSRFQELHESLQNTPYWIM